VDDPKARLVRWVRRRKLARCSRTKRRGPPECAVLQQRFSGTNCDKEVATDSKALWTRIRKASWARTPDSPMSSEGREATTARPTKKPDSTCHVSPYIILFVASLISHEEEGSDNELPGCNNHGNGSSLGAKAIDGRHGARSRKVGYDRDRPSRQCQFDWGLFGNERSAAFAFLSLLAAERAKSRSHKRQSGRRKCRPTG
jgi:hypothetical protein